MKKNGFTLIEILGVVAVLGIISLVAVPNIINSLKKAEENKANAYKKQILQSTETFVEQNRDLFDPRLQTLTSHSVYIIVNDVVITGYVQSTFANPAGGTAADDKSCVKVVYDTSTKLLDYTYVLNNANGSADEKACNATKSSYITE